MLKRVLDRVHAIHAAIVEDDMVHLQQLVDSAKLATARLNSGRTPLHTAVLFERMQCAQYLLLLYPHTVDAKDQVISVAEVACGRLL